MTTRAAPHVCSACGHRALRWSGRCPSCAAWNTLEASPLPSAGWVPQVVGDAGSMPVPLAEVPMGATEVLPTGLSELDRVLSGGLVPGSVTVLGGEPGVGKSTLLLQVLAARASAGARVLLASAEESAHQVRRRAGRLGELAPGLLVLPGTSIAAIEAAVDAVRPELVVVDSIQSVVAGEPTPGRSPGAGSVARVRECAEVLAAMAKRADVATVLVGHVTKDGSLAGPRALEHLVDTVLSFEGDRHHALRLLRAVKHRFGPTGEIGLFQMGEAGLAPVDDPARLLLGDRRPGAPGGTVVAVLEGRRTLVAELQALVVHATTQQPRRASVGLDPGRLAMTLAVLQRHTDLPVRHVDVFASVVGGIRATEPAADLAVAIAVASAVSGVPVPSDLVAVGEVGLTGEVRQVPDLRRRLDESARCGFSRAVVPRSAPPGPDGMQLVRVDSVGQALAHLDLISLGRPPASGQARPGTLLA